MRGYLVIKRAVDLIVAPVLIILSSPAWLFGAVATKLSSPGPLFFTQERVGRNGQTFRLYKFRTMRADHVHDPTEFMPLHHGGITRIGRMLRRTKIDELPQLLNIFKGDMTLIGPRPTIMEQVREYNDFERRRLNIRPGLTGLAQVNGNAGISWQERIKYDVYYVDHVCPSMDLMILLRTIYVVFAGEQRCVRLFEDSPYAAANSD
jgi:lipopolysaccharide/colanic/teichoic acid biosynthesis glycosyltransferase